MLKLMYITNNPQVAHIAEQYGVDYVWIDLETMGKEERQKGIDSVKSHHKISDIRACREVLTTSNMLVRINPWNAFSTNEINEVIEAGAQTIMLPMWKTADEVRKFINAINGRAKNILLLETKEAEEALDDVLKIKGIDAIHIGLNDLHLSYGLTFMFELLANGTVERIVSKIKKVGIPYGFGGIAKIGEGIIPAEKLITEHYRLGSNMAILSRTFCDAVCDNDLSKIENVFANEIVKIRNCEKLAAKMSEQAFNANHQNVCDCVNSAVYAIKEKRYA